MPLSSLEKPESGRTLARALPWIVAIFDLMIVAFAAYTLHWSKGQFIDRAEMATHNLAQVLEQSLLATVKQIDLVLLTIKDEALHPDQATRLQRMKSSLQAQLPRIQILDALRVTDAQGTVQFGTSFPEELGVSLEDREYFQQLKQFPDQGMIISRPLISRISGKQILVFARRLDGLDGEFAGIVYGTLPLDRLAQVISSVDVGERGSVSLRSADLELLARHPRLPGQNQLMGDRTIGGDYLEAVQSGRTVSHFTAHSRLDGEARTYTLRRIASPPFFILVGLAQADYLPAWRHEVRYAALAVVALITLSLAMAWMARAAWRRQTKVTAFSEAQEAKFRLLAENAEDVIWIADPHGRITYISPVVTTQRGYQPEEILGVPFQDRHVVGRASNPLQNVLDRVKGLPPGTQPFEGECLEAELPRKDGGRFQAEIRLRLLWGHKGQFLGFQGVTRDITERARLEAERENLIRDLQKALADVKNLEGMLPICGHCKKIRDDRGYWNHLESYISAHTDATFTHGVCPECADALRQEMRERKGSREAG